MNTNHNKEKLESQIIKCLTDHSIKFDVSSDNTINVTFSGEGLPITFAIFVDTHIEHFAIQCALPFSILEKSSDDMIRVISALNDKLRHGVFFMDKNNIMYECAMLSIGDVIDESTFFDLLSISILIISEYGADLFAISKGLLDAELFIQSLNFTKPTQNT